MIVTQSSIRNRQYVNELLPQAPEIGVILDQCGARLAFPSKSDLASRLAGYWIRTRHEPGVCVDLHALQATYWMGLAVTSRDSISSRLGQAEVPKLSPEGCMPEIPFRSNLCAGVELRMGLASNQQPANRVRANRSSGYGETAGSLVASVTY